MELQQISEQISEKIRQLEELRLKLKDVAIERAEASVEYEKELAKTIVGLKNGAVYNIDDKVIENPPTTILEKIAKGICSAEKLKADLAESRYRNLITIIELIKSQMNALQSLNKNLTET